MSTTNDPVWLTAIEVLEVPEELKQRLREETASFMALSGGSGGPVPDPRVSADVPAPYEDRGVLGAGGMGQVHRVADPRLHRTLALKTLHPRLADNARARLRFLEEAQVTAQLQHPGIPPVHEVGHLPDGRPYFTMLEVHGDTLAQALDLLHQARPDPTDRRRLLSAVCRAAEAVAYAHERGVVHRDLKPANIMLGAFGEVWVMDWGLTRVTRDEPDAPQTVREQDPFETREGSIQGTPAYMAPEQARGERADARSDVWALGSLLHQVWTGAPAVQASHVMALILKLSRGPEAPTLPDAPADLAALIRRALAPEPADRFATAGAFAHELRAFLDGARARDRAQALVRRADRLQDEADDCVEQADAVARRAADLEATLPADADEAARWPVWEAEDRAAELGARADALRIESELLLEGALTHVPELAEARRRLAIRHRRAHAAAEHEGRTVDALRHEARLRRYGDERYADYLDGTGVLTVRTDPPGAEVELRPEREVRRRMVPGDVVHHGPAPVEQRLPAGTYRVRLTTPGRSTVTLSVQLPRGAHEAGVHPAGEPRPVVLPPASALGPDACWVAEGWAWVGRREQDWTGAPHLPWQRVWVPSFAVRRDVVTNGEYVAFLDALVAEGHEERAVAHAPRYPGGAPVWRRSDDGGFALGEDLHGHTWTADMPVVLVDWHDARAFAAWESERTGQSWRLGTEIEWEKAARGTDGRPLPWGWHAFEGWCRMRGSPWPQPGPAPVGAFEGDVSPYGVRGCAGNVAEWVLDGVPDGFGEVQDGVAVVGEPRPAPRRRLKGGCWMYGPAACRVDTPGSQRADGRMDYIGLRLFRSV